jgi:histidine triad (HIT) family protein
MMAYRYDDQNIFARILRGEIPCNKVKESTHTLAFHDIAPQAPVHVLVIPKGPYMTYDHFALEASEEEIVDFTRMVGEICAMTEVQPGMGGGGYRMVANSGEAAIQDVPHLHVHILGGRLLGRMLRDPGT